MGTARGVTTGGRGAGTGPADRYAALNMLLGESNRDYEARDTGVGRLDRVPGWLLLAVVLIGFLIAVFVYDWR
jgi:hypothetical protein